MSAAPDRPDGERPVYSDEHSGGHMLRCIQPYSAVSIVFVACASRRALNTHNLTLYSHGKLRSLPLLFRDISWTLPSHFRRLRCLPCLLRPARRLLPVGLGRAGLWAAWAGL